MFRQSTVQLISSVLAAVVYGEYQQSKLIVGLNNFFDFDHNIFLLDKTVDITQLINGTESTPRSVFQGNKSVIFQTIFSVEYNRTFIIPQFDVQSKNPFMIVVPDSCKIANYSDLLEQVLEIGLAPDRKKIGFFLPDFASTDDVLELFEWCRENYIVNIFATRYYYLNAGTERRLHIFTFNYFGPLNVINLTNCEYEDFFANTKSNNKKLTVQPLDTITSYFSPALFPTFFDIEERHMNVAENYSNVAVSVIPAVSFEWDRSVYNFFKIPQVIVVPQALPYSDFSGYLRTLTSDIFFVHSLIIIAVVILLLYICRYIEQKKILFFKSVVDICNLLMNDNGYIKYQLLSHSECFLIVPFTFAGLIFVNGMLSNLQSYLTVPAYQKQVDTLEDVYAESFPILTWNEDWKNYIIDGLLKQSNLNFTDRIIAVDMYEFSENISRYERIAFVTSMSTANLLVQGQKRMNTRGYHVTKIVVGNYYFNYPIDSRSPFFERINEIIYGILGGGLYDLWTRQEFEAYESKVLIKNLEQSRFHDEGVVNKIEFPFFIVYSWIAGIVVLIIEITWKKMCDAGIQHRVLHHIIEQISL